MDKQLNFYQIDAHYIDYLLKCDIIIKDANGKDISSIRFSFMIPVPPEVVTVKRIDDEPSFKYRILLNMELQFCRRNANAIYSRARFVYDSVIKRKDPLMIKNCCNFNALEVACAEYVKSDEHKTSGGE